MTLGLRHVRYAMVVAVIALVGWLVWQARGALIPFVVGGVLAYVLSPMVERLARVMPFRQRRRELARTLSILIVYIVGLGTLAGAGAMIVPAVISEATEFVENIPSYVEQARRQAEVWTERYRERVPEDVQQRIDAATDDAGNSLGAVGQAMLSRTFGILRNTFALVFGYIIIPFWLFYILKDRHKIGPAIKEWFPPGLAADVDQVIRICQRVLGSYIRAQLTLGLFIGVVTTVGLFLLDIQFFLILGIIAGVTELIPVIGPILGALPALIVVLATEPEKFWIVLIFYVAVQQLENAVLVPRIQGSAVDMHPALIIVLLVIAQQVAGFGGMIVAVPVVAVTRDVFKYVYRRLQEREAQENDARVLRVPRQRVSSGSGAAADPSESSAATQMLSTRVAPAADGGGAGPPESTGAPPAHGPASPADASKRSTSAGEAPARSGVAEEPS